MRKFRQLFNLVVLLLPLGIHGFLSESPLRKVLSFHSRFFQTQLSSSTSSPDDMQKLLDKAAKLREEAQAMESQLRAERGTSQPVVMETMPEPRKPEVKYAELPNSQWEITYRFAEEPVKDRDEDAPPVEYFRGKLTLLLRDDGYTEILSHQQDGDGGQQIKVVKIWGWDEELSQEDKKRYLLFSMDAKTPTTSKLRFYFQALLEQESRTAVALKEGTVTIKQDLAEKQKMMNFGFFSAKGILAQFRYVGEFSAKPVGEEEES